MTDPRPEAGTRGGFNGWWLGSAMFVLAVLVAAVLMVVLGGRGSSPAPQDTATGAAAEPSANGTSSSGGSTGCSLEAGNTKVPSQAPNGVRWEIVNTVAVPWSAAGPAVRDGAVRRCYAHSPTGALLAAANLAVTTQSPGADQVLQDQVLPGPTRDAMLQAARTQPPQAKQAGETAAFAGFRFISYTPQVAVVQLAYAFGGKYGSETYRMQWQSGDWKLNLDPAGGSTPGGPLGSLAGFVAWGAV